MPAARLALTRFQANSSCSNIATSYHTTSLEAALELFNTGGEADLEGARGATLGMCIILDAEGSWCHRGFGRCKHASRAHCSARWALASPMTVLLDGRASKGSHGRNQIPASA